MAWRWWMALLAAVALLAVLVYEDRVGDEAAQPVPTPTEEGRTADATTTPLPWPTRVPWPTRTAVLPQCRTPKPLGEETRMSTSIYAGDVARARAIRHKYDPLFWRQPNVHGVGIGIIEDENGEFTDRAGFIVRVTEKVDQSTLPVEDRIPDCLEGVLVEIREAPTPVLTSLGPPKGIGLDNGNLMGERKLRHRPLLAGIGASRTPTTALGR